MHSYVAAVHDLWCTHASKFLIEDTQVQHIALKESVYEAYQTLAHTTLSVSCPEHKHKYTQAHTGPNEIPLCFSEILNHIGNFYR